MQALCGALAVFAKREAICRIARKQGGKRPAVSLAAIPADRPSLGLYVLIYADNLQFPDGEDFKSRIELLLEAFPPIREIAYFPVTPRNPEFPSEIPIGKVFLRKQTNVA